MFVDDTIYAGSTWYYEETFASFSAKEWSLEVYLKLADNDAVKITATPINTSSFLISKSAADTVIDQGKYAFQYVFTNLKTKQVAVPFEGFVQVKSLLSVSGDLRSDDEKVLEKLYAARLAIAERDYVSVDIGDKSVEFKSLEDIESMINVYESKLGINKPQRVLYSFE